MILNNYKVTTIEFNDCKEWFLYKHYLKRFASFTYIFGLYKDNYLVGVCSYGRPVSHSLVKGAFNGHYQNNFLELNRLVINDDLEKNCLSYFLSKSLKMIPKPKVVVSYADTALGHHGYIYQATNWIYTGLSAKRKDYKIRGLDIHSASLLDREGRNIGKGKIKLIKEKYGDDLYTEVRPRKHRYFYLLADKKTKKEMIKNLSYKIQSYPKGKNNRYDASYKPIVQGILF